MGLESANSTREPAYRLGLIYLQLHDCGRGRGEQKKQAKETRQ